VTLSRIEHAAFRLVVQCLNQLATVCLNYEKDSDKILSYVCMCLCVWCVCACVCGVLACAYVVCVCVCVCGACLSSLRVLFLSDFSQIVRLRQILVKVQNVQLLENLSGGIRAVSC